MAESEAGLEVDITTREIRWKGAHALEAAVVAKLRPLAEAAGADVLEILMAHVANQTEPMRTQDGWDALPRIAPKTMPFHVWRSVRAMAQDLRAILDDPAPIDGDLLRGLRDAARMCEQLAARGDLSGAGLAHNHGLNPAVQETARLRSKWLGAERPPDARSRLVNAELPSSLIAVTGCLTGLLAWLAFDAQADGLDKLLGEQRARVLDALGSARSELAAEIAAAKKHNEQLEEAGERAATILANVEAASGVKATDIFKGTFEKSAEAHASSANRWLAGAVVLGGLALAAAGVFVYSAWQPRADLTWESIVVTAIPRVLFASIVLSGAFFSARMFSMNRRAQMVDVHRQNALRSYVQLMGAAGTNERARTAVLSAVTACVFGRSSDETPEPTLPGLSDGARTVRDVSSR